MIRRALGAFAFLLLVASPAWAVTAHVQHKADGCGGVTACAATFDSNVTAGNVIAVFVWLLNNTDTISSVTDTLGNTYTALDNPTDCGAFSRAALFYAKNIAGGANTVTANFSGTTGVRTVIVHEISGADTTSPLEGASSRINCQGTPGTGTDAVTSTSQTTATNGDYIFGATAGAVVTCTSTVGTGYTAAVTAAGYYCTGSEYQIQGSAGAIAATFTIDSGLLTDELTGIMAFKPAAAAAANPCVVGGGFMRAGCV